MRSCQQYTTVCMGDGCSNYSHRMIEQKMCKVFAHCRMTNKKKEDTIDAVCHDNTRNKRDTLCMLYAKVAKRQDMNFQYYCRYLQTLLYSNVQQSMGQELHKCSKTWRKPRRIQNFSESPRGDRGKVMLYIS